MAPNDNAMNDSWVNDQLASLEPDPRWQPDAARSFERLTAARSRRTNMAWPATIVVVAALGATLGAFPSTRLFAAQCIEACAAVFTRGRLDVTRTAVGGIAPDFSRTTSTGEAITLSDYRGQVVLLNFWATWCGPCEREMPWFAEFQATYKDLTVVGVSMDEDGWTSVKPFLERSPVNYPIVVGDDELSEQYGGISALPLTMLIDRSGRIVAIQTGIVEKNAYESAIRAALRAGSRTDFERR